MRTSLPTQFRSDGFDFRLIRRKGTVAMLAKQKPHHSRPSYEVIIIQKRPSERVFGQNLPAREVMPASETWGTLGWSYIDRVCAEARFDQLCQAQRKGHFPPKGFVPSASKAARGRKAMPPTPKPSL
jgi:hypothetical protein